MVDTGKLESLCRELLLAIGENPERPGLQDTPRRWAAWWREFIDHEAGNTFTIFPSANVDQMVVLTGIRVWSLCEHHLLPFWCDVAIGYIADGNIIGISKLVRIAKKHARRLQVQEHLVANIADEVARTSGSEDVAVTARGEHLCMQMRGVESEALMISHAMRGDFRVHAEVRAEFLRMISGER